MILAKRLPAPYRQLFGFWAMSRPAQVLSVIMVTLTGAFIARGMYGGFDGAALIWSLIALLPVTFSIHYANEYADFETDSLTQPTAFSGGSGALPAGLLPRSWALHAAWLMLILGLSLGLIGVMLRLLSPAAFFILMIGAVGGWMYSLPPLKLAWRGWGELDNALLGGMALPVYGYATQTGSIDLTIILISLPFTTLVFINLLATTWADRDADAAAGKFTLATQLSIKKLRMIYLSAAGFSVALIFVLGCWLLPKEILLGMLIVTPMIGWGALTYTRIHSPHPTVLTMVAMLVIQMLAWFLVGL